MNSFTLLAAAPDTTPATIADTVARVWNFKLFSVDDVTVTVSRIIIAVGMLIIGSIAAKVISGYVGKRVLPRLKIDRGPATALQSILYYVLLAMAIMLALQTASVPLTIFTIFGGALALGIGFGSQNIMANFISGLILLIERPVSVGDLVKVGDELGEVVKVGARATHLRGYRGASFIIPNSTLLESPVHNWNHADDLVRSVVPVGVAYGSPTDRVRDLLLAACGRVDSVLTDPTPAVLFTDFADSALAFEVHFWSRPDTTLERLSVESDFRFAVDAIFRDGDICIAFPQQDIHLDSTSPVEVRVIS